MTTIVRKEATPKQLAIVSQLTPQVQALGIKEPTKSAWHASGVIGRISSPDRADIGALDALNARPFYARSAREAEWQRLILTALSEARKADNEAGYKAFATAMAEQFERRARS
jgi:hypothetical protein